MPSAPNSLLGQRRSGSHINISGHTPDARKHGLGRCLEPSSGTADGTRIQLWDCVPHSPGSAAVHRHFLICDLNRPISPGHRSIGEVRPVSRRLDRDPHRWPGASSVGGGAGVMCGGDGIGSLSCTRGCRRGVAGGDGGQVLRGLPSGRRGCSATARAGTRRKRAVNGSATVRWRSWPTSTCARRRCRGRGEADHRAT